MYVNIVFLSLARVDVMADTRGKYGPLLRPQPFRAIHVVLGPIASVSVIALGP